MPGRRIEGANLAAEQSQLLGNEASRQLTVSCGNSPLSVLTSSEIERILRPNGVDDTPGRMNTPRSALFISAYRKVEAVPGSQFP